MRLCSSHMETLQTKLILAFLSSTTGSGFTQFAAESLRRLSSQEQGNLMKSLSNPTIITKDGISKTMPNDLMTLYFHTSSSFKTKKNIQTKFKRNQFNRQKIINHFLLLNFSLVQQKCQKLNHDLGISLCLLIC